MGPSVCAQGGRAEEVGTFHSGARVLQRRDGRTVRAQNGECTVSGAMHVVYTGSRLTNEGPLYKLCYLPVL